MKIDVFIFDIDGVLIDVSESYRTAIRQATQLYLEQALGLAPFPGELISSEDVAAFKMAGGFNNDWDLTTALVQYFVAMLNPVAGTRRLEQTADILASLRQAGASGQPGVAELYRHKDIPALAQQLQALGGGMGAAGQVLGTRNQELVYAVGDPRGTNLVKRIFEEVYLGEEYFRLEYGQDSIIARGPGLIRRERLIVNPATVQTLANRVALGIATGRPRNQALYALEAAGIRDHWRSLVTHEDNVAAAQKILQESGQRVSMSKPHPFSLLEAVRRITSERVRCAYIGDTLDDVRAANAAKAEMDYVSIACLAPATDKALMRREFERVGADVIVEHPDEVTELITA